MIIVLSLYIFAYFFGKNVVAPRRNASGKQTPGNTQQTAVLKDGQSAPIQPLCVGESASNEQLPKFGYAELEDLNGLETRISEWKEEGISSLLIPVAWSLTEQSEGVISLDRYETALDRLQKEGFRFILILDAGGRAINVSGLEAKSSIPAWVFRKVSPSLDCYGKCVGAEGSLSYSDEAGSELLVNYVKRVVPELKARYETSIIAFAPAVTPDLTVAYPEAEEAWFDYSENAENRFRAFLRDKYDTIEALNEACSCSYVSFAQITLPTGMLSANSIANGVLNEAAVYPDFQLFREEELKVFLKPVYQAIKAEGYQTAARFGCVLSVDDGKTAAGIALKLSDSVDFAIVEVTVSDTVLPAMTANCLKTAGYQKVYLQADLNAVDSQQLTEALDYASADGSLDGIVLNRCGDRIKCSRKSHAQADYAIYVGEWNFYRSQGEAETHTAYFSDSISQMYKIVCFELGRNVAIVSDEAIQSGRLGQYSVLIIPAQFYVSDETVAAIEQFAKNGGALLQDYRFGEWDMYGKNRGNWSDELFGIAARNALISEKELVGSNSAVAGMKLSVDPVYRNVPNLFEIAVTGDAKALFTDSEGHTYGVIQGNNACLCFQPQLQYKYESDLENRRLCVELIRLLLEQIRPETAVFFEPEHSVVVSEEQPVTLFLSDIQYVDLDSTIPVLKESNVNTLTIPLPWTFLESSKGAFSPELYVEPLNRLAEEGFQFIFILDGSGRDIPLNGVVLDQSVPAWVYEEAVPAMDFTGSTRNGRAPLSFFYEQNKALYLDFCEKTIECFGALYGDRIVGFAPGIAPELEVKYPQWNYNWYDYSEGAKKAFREFLCEKYDDVEVINDIYGTKFKSFDEADMPLVNYNNSIRTSLREAPLFNDFLVFRERSVVKYISPVCDLIHEEGYQTIAYFGQLFHPHDAIYAAGLVSSLSECIDTAVIDFNYYDGYHLISDSIIPAMLTNYVKAIGYGNVWTGIYCERLDLNLSTGLLQESVNYAAQDGRSDGFEFGGMVDQVREGSFSMDLSFRVTQRNESARIAIYVSEWNFYHDHGETPPHVDYLLDSLSQMYQIVRFELGYEVDIIGDEAIGSDRIRQYDLLIIPAQLCLGEESAEAIVEYVKNGGRVLQDFRLGELDEYGEVNSFPVDSLFHITGKESLVLDGTLKGNADFLSGITIPVTPLFEHVPNAYAVAGEPDVTYLFQTDDGRYFGTKAGRTCSIGFQPQLHYKYSDDENVKKACVTVLKNIIDRMLSE